MKKKDPGGSALQHALLHPLISSSFTNLLRLLLGYGCDARFVPRALYLAVVTLLRQPVIWFEAARYGSRIRGQPLAPPVIIVGHWRSGTTHLHNVMSQDPRFGTVTLLHAGMPNDFLTLAGIARRHLASQLPEKRLMDNVPVHANAPWEEEMALTSTGRMSFYHVSFFPRRMESIFNEAVMFDDGDPQLQATWEHQYLAFLRKIQFAQPGMPLLLKNPANTARLRPLRKLLPGTKFIHIHRDPYKVFVSTIHLYLRAQEAWGLQRPDRDRLVQHVLDSYPRLMRAFFADRGLLGTNELAEVSFNDLQCDAMGTLASIYEQLQLPGFTEAVPRFESYLESQRDYKKNVLPIADDEKADVARRWSDIFEQLGYPV